jgi:hypothetical protein
VVEDGARIRSSIVASQYATHGKDEGVVPELASREHVRNIVPVVREAAGHYSSACFFIPAKCCRTTASRSIPCAVPPLRFSRPQRVQTRAS